MCSALMHSVFFFFADQFLQFQLLIQPTCDFFTFDQKKKKTFSTTATTHIQTNRIWFYFASLKVIELIAQPKYSFGQIATMTTIVSGNCLVRLEKLLKHTSQIEYLTCVDLVAVRVNEKHWCWKWKCKRTSQEKKMVKSICFSIFWPITKDFISSLHFNVNHSNTIRLWTTNRLIDDDIYLKSF